MIRTLLLITAAIAISACNNTRNRGTTGSSTDTTANVVASVDEYKINTVTIASTGSTSGSGTSSFEASIYFNTSTSSSIPISNHCSPASGFQESSKPCLCQFSWTEVNTTGGSSVSIPRLVHTSVSKVQASMVGCATPLAYASGEIGDGTVIKITIIPQASSTESFSVNTYNYVKSSSAQSGSFQDAQGRAFMNIARYSCYDQRVRGMAVTSKTGTRTNPATGEAATYPYANRFCIAKANSGQPPEGCENLPGPENSAQSYYYNLYIRESEVGDINPGNNRYTCPTVAESLTNTGSIGSQGKYWPLDTSFALSLGKTTDFNVGVVANTRTSKSNDPVSAPTSCDSSETSSGGNRDDTLVKSCLGFAAKPNSDGTCPFIRDSSGAIRFTYRLRRYIAIYPQVFDTDGAILNQAQATDTIYVLDRPVNASTNPDPMKPYTMRGPKPCPFAYFDHKQVLGPDTPSYLGSYAGTNDSRWTGTNVDGIQFPNQDLPNSCSAMIPVLNSDNSLVTPATVSLHHGAGRFKRLYVRPVRAWAPHYEEDTSFQACAPLADPLRDPPLHFARNTTSGNIAWCAEAYPTQNNNVTKVDQRELSVTSSFSGTGAGWSFTFAGTPLGANAVVEYISVAFSDANNFTVRGTTSGDIGTGSTGVAFNSAVVNFTILAGATPFVAGDLFILTVTRSPAGNFVGTVRNYTSHTVKSSSSAACTASTSSAVLTIPSAPTYPASTATTGLARHSSLQAWDGTTADKTCDRTVINPLNGIGWPRFPLLAPPSDVESALASTTDTSYQCTVSFDNGGSKTDKYTPTEGCCGANTQAWTGLGLSSRNANSAHLEPGTACLVPQY